MIRVFATKTKWTPNDKDAFFGPPPYSLKITEKPVYVSVTFTWDIGRGKWLAGIWEGAGFKVKLGGPAFDDPGGEFVPRRFLQRSIIITSRGCPKRCPWCYVWKREGDIRELPVRDGWVVQDNNLLACSRGHIESVFEMLARQPISASFPGGLDLDYLEDWHIGLFRNLQKVHRLGCLWVAFDTEKSLDKLPLAKEMLGEFHINRRFAYVLIGFTGDTIERAENRLERVYDEERGFLPFAMLFDGIKDNPVWKKLQRKWCRPAAYRPRKSPIVNRQLEMSYE